MANKNEPELESQFERLRKAVESDTRFDARKISEILRAFDAKIPPADLAEIMVGFIKNDEVPARTKEKYMAFILGLKKFQEKNEPKLDDEEINKLETDQAYAWLRATFMPQLAEVEVERDRLAAQVEKLKARLEKYEKKDDAGNTESQERDGAVHSAV